MCSLGAVFLLKIQKQLSKTPRQDATVLMICDLDELIQSQLVTFGNIPFSPVGKGLKNSRTDAFF